MSRKIANSYPERNEILQYVLAETGQKNNFPTDANKIIDFLKLHLVYFDFAEFGHEKFNDGRAILSYNQKTIAINSNITNKHQINFSKMHDVAHYVLPNHVERFYYCRQADMSPYVKVQYELEANAFAADLIYKGGIFTEESNSVETTFESIVSLHDKYDSSLESTGRRFAEHSMYPCIFVVYDKDKKEEMWKVKYAIFSKSFLGKYLKSPKGEFTDDDSEDVIRAEYQPNTIIDSECKISIRNEREETFRCQYLYNGYKVLAIIKEK